MPPPTHTPHHTPPSLLLRTHTFIQPDKKCRAPPPSLRKSLLRRRIQTTEIIVSPMTSLLPPPPACQCQRAICRGRGKKCGVITTPIFKLVNRMVIASLKIYEPNSFHPRNIFEDTQRIAGRAFNFQIKLFPMNIRCLKIPDTIGCQEFGNYCTQPSGQRQESSQRARNMSASSRD